MKSVCGRHNKKSGEDISPLFVHKALISALYRSANRASTSASAAVDASVSVDNVLTIALRDRVYGAAICACAARDALIIDYICHFSIPP